MHGLMGVKSVPHITAAVGETRVSDVGNKVALEAPPGTAALEALWKARVMWPVVQADGVIGNPSAEAPSRNQSPSPECRENHT